MKRARAFNSNRRSFLRAAGAITAGLVAASRIPDLAIGQTKKTEEEKPQDIGPTEDLMREHGILNRVLLIYDHFIHQIDKRNDFNSELVASSARIIRSFVEDYHERQEEEFLFPRFEKAGLLTDLVPILRLQHDAGRRLTDQIISLTRSRGTGDRVRLSGALKQFVRMYRPHEAREDTVLFPALRKIVSKHEFDSLGEQFEKNEHKQFGTDGFDLYLDKVSQLEKELGIYNLAQFTPAA